MGDGPIILDTPEQIRMFGLLQIKYRLKLEVETGLKFRQSTLKAANYVLGTNYRRKAQALAAIIEYIEQEQEMQRMATDVKYPNVEVQLSGEDGNAFMIMGKTQRALRRAGVPDETIREYLEESKLGDYDHLLQTTMNWVTVL